MGQAGSHRIYEPPRSSLYDGLIATSQNRFPSLRFDLGAIAGLAAPLLPAGFYYKSFMWPPAFWKRFYEPAIRRAAGLGRAPREPDPDRYLHHYAHCDVLIIGGGPAGLAAALGASATGARVILCDEQAELGGSLLHEPNVTIDGWPAPDWAREAIATLGDKVTLLPRTTAFGWYPNNLIGLLQRVTDHLTEPPRSCRGSACGRSAPDASYSPPARSSDPSSFPPTTAPASCWPPPLGCIYIGMASRSAAAW